jgi:hypothetical protein
MAKKPTAPRAKARRPRLAPAKKAAKKPVKKATPARTSREDDRAVREYMKLREPAIDRYIERWARRLIFVIDGKVRRPTEEEVRQMASPPRRKAVRKRVARKPPAKRR